MNLSTNRQACSRDIGKMYVKHQILKYIINGGSWGNNHRYTTCKSLGLYFNLLLIIFIAIFLPIRECASSHIQCLAKSDKFLKFMYQNNIREQSEKEIYQTGSLRLVSMARNKNKLIIDNIKYLTNCIYYIKCGAL